MATLYINFTPKQEPNDEMGLDDVGRPQVVVNFDVLKEPSLTTPMTKEVSNKLVAAGVLPVTSIFRGPRAAIPAGDGPYLSIKATGGTGPIRRQGDGVLPAYVRPSIQLLCRATDYDLAHSTLLKAYNALIGVRSQTLS